MRKRKFSRLNSISYKKKAIKKLFKSKSIIETTSHNTAIGKFTPENPEKYIGDPTNIIYRSSWELDYMKMLDRRKDILRWSSETIAIPYIKPTDGKVHNYFPDFFVEYVDKEGNIHKEIVEIKPYKQTIQPDRRGKNKRQQIYEAVTWEINKAKWKAAEEFCSKNGIKFRILTEKNMYK